MTKREAASIILVVGGLIFWLAETAYFGWNREPSGVPEMICDWIAIAAVLTGFIIKPTTKEYRTTNINTQNVEVIKPIIKEKTTSSGKKL